MLSIIVAEQTQAMWGHWCGPNLTTSLSCIELRTSIPVALYSVWPCSSGDVLVMMTMMFILTRSSYSYLLLSLLDHQHHPHYHHNHHYHHHHHHHHHHQRHHHLPTYGYRCNSMILILSVSIAFLEHQLLPYAVFQLDTKSPSNSILFRTSCIFIYPWLERITKLFSYGWSNLGDLTRLGEALSNYYCIIVQQKLSYRCSGWDLVAAIVRVFHFQV